MKRNRIIYGLGIFGLAVLTLMLNLTSPTEIGPLGVLLFFTTLYIVSFALTVFLMQAFIRVAFKRQQMKNKNYLYAAVFAFGPIMLLMVYSFGAVTPWVISLIGIFLFLAEFLVYKRI